jgi:glycosyltransferase involved in cell wall biosynthesis
LRGVSVIICCYNASGRIQNTLQYLANQKCSVDFEVLIIDNKSEDDTIEISKKEWGKHKSDATLRFFIEERQGKSFAFERGLIEAKYNFILICDDDNWLTEDYIQTGFNILDSNPKIGALGGIGIPRFEEKPPAWFTSILKGGYAFGPQGDKSGDITDKGWLYGAGVFIRKDLFLKVKNIGFNNYLTGPVGNNLLSGEDVEICYIFKICGYKIWYDERLKFFHYTEKYRTEWNYALRIFKGRGAANVILTCYKLAISKNVKLFNRQLWYLEVARLLKNILLSRSTYNYLIFKKRTNENNLSTAKLLGEFSCLLTNKNLFEKNRTDVIYLSNYFNFFNKP